LYKSPNQDENRIRFETIAQAEAHEKVSGYLSELFGEMAKPVPTRAVFLLQMGSTLTHIVVAPWGDDDAVVMVRAYVVYGADLAPDLLRYLLEKNASMRFGAFGLDRDGDIFFEHSIVGSTCDKEELKASIMAVTHTADRQDEQIMERWGGLREMDRIKELI
jgi:hypothetical protein